MIIVQAPLRISLFGGGTDFQDFYQERNGAVLSMAINKYIYIIVTKRFDEDIYINYSKKEIVNSIDDIEHDLVREALRITGIKKGIEITSLADIPANGSGLGSSSTFTVGLLHALYAYLGDLMTAETLASEACKIEIDILKKPIGRQDQYIAAYGNLRLINFSNSHIDVQKIDIPAETRRKLFENLLVFYTGLRKDSATVLSEQKAKITSHRDILDEMRVLASRAKDVLVSGDITDLGQMLYYNWQLKKQLSSGISNPIIDNMYETALKAGASGGKTNRD
jgi:D-glycero-alpha-D-manno-heptose-7-phosphate kinase